MRELFREFVVMKERQRYEFERGTVQAYQTVLIHWMTKSKKGRMPTLETLLATKDTARQTSTQMGNVLRVLSAQYGIPLRKATRH